MPSGEPGSVNRNLTHNGDRSQVAGYISRGSDFGFHVSNFPLSKAKRIGAPQGYCQIANLKR